MVTMDSENSEIMIQPQPQPQPQPLSQPMNEEVTLETLAEEVGATVPLVASNNGGQLVNHPLFTPTSPRSVTTTSMSASGKTLILPK